MLWTQTILDLTSSYLIENSKNDSHMSEELKNYTFVQYLILFQHFFFTPFIIINFIKVLFIWIQMQDVKRSKRRVYLVNSIRNGFLHEQSVILLLPWVNVVCDIGQAAHTVEPMSSPYEPRGQGEQGVTPVTDHCPLGHASKISNTCEIQLKEKYRFVCIYL